MMPLTKLATEALPHCEHRLRVNHGQLLIDPARSCEVLDLAADTLGLACGLLLTELLHRLSSSVA